MSCTWSVDIFCNGRHFICQLLALTGNALNLFSVNISGYIVIRICK